MKQLMKLRLFSLLKDASCVKLSTQLENAYEEFSVKLLDKLQTETNITKLYYIGEIPDKK